MALQAIAGQKIFIGGQKSDQAADFVASDFSGETWVEIDGWETAGGYGDTFALITTQLINRGRDVKQKGTANAGSMENNFAIIRDDAGQVALRAAAKGRQNFAFKIEDNDKPNDSAGSAPTMAYFVALPMSAMETGGTANTVQMLSCPLEINSNIVPVAAVDGS